MHYFLFVSAQTLCQPSCTQSMLISSTCYPQCMSESCNFQNSNENCMALCLQSGCSLDLLTNQICDPVCNTSSCGWDYGACGFCAPNCFVQDLLNCSPACRVPSCPSICSFADLCSANCTSDMIGNGVCDQSCMTRNCSFDYPDCITSQVSLDCYLPQIGDGVCDPSCNLDQAFWDGWDCACSAGCTDDMLSNSVCDQACNTLSCNFDSEMCLACSPGCSRVNIGDGKCDLLCMTESCFYDLGDCDCSPGCNFMMMGDGICQKICNNIQCNYDGGHCANCNTGCSPDLRNNGVCDNACNTKSCNYDDSDCICAQGCLPEMLGNGICDELCNNYLCNYDNSDCSLCASKCFSYLLADGKCDSICNTASCSFDSGDCLCSPKCTPDLLSNSICDPECNTLSCNFDNTHCTPCLCDLKLLGNQICDLSCNTTSCLYDGGDCLCPSACTVSLLSNSVCDPECNSPLCNFDNFHCAECAAGCKWVNINDGICQIACSVLECGFDGSDCSCSASCQESFLLNSNCDKPCDSWSCNKDNQMCLECSNGCTLSMINNGVCDSQCYNQQCYFDGFDCLCSQYCLSVSSCDYSCIVPACDYSRKICDVYQITRNLVFRSTVSPSGNFDSSACVNVNSGCLSLMMNNVCDSICNVKECLWDFGACSVCNLPNCQQCIGNYCITCVNGMFSYYGKCFNFIPESAAFYSENPGFLLPKKDLSSASLPSLIYVSPVKVAKIETGSLQNPFSSLAVALASIYSYYTKVVLISGNHYLKGFQGKLGIDKNYKMVNLETLMCSDHNITGCSLSPAVVLLLDSVSFINVQYSATFSVKNVIFNGQFSLNSTCLNDFCYYCPYFEKRNSVYYNDKDQSVNIKFFAKSCSVNNQTTFLSFESGGSLILQNVTFYNFRQQFKAVLDLSRVSAVFVNASFMYVQASNNGSVIIQNTGSLVWMLGLVKFVNYGYEYRDNLLLSPFLLSSGSTLIQLKYLLIEWNVAFSRSLFQFSDVQEFIFVYCQVFFNRGESLFAIFSEKSSHSHVEINNLVFANNLVESGNIIRMDFKTQPKTVYLDSLKFTNNTLDVGLGLVYIKSSDVSLNTPLALISNSFFEYNAGGLVHCIFVDSLHSFNLSNLQVNSTRIPSALPSSDWVLASKSLGYYYKLTRNTSFAETQSSIKIVNIKQAAFIEAVQVKNQAFYKVMDFSNNTQIRVNFAQFSLNFAGHSVLFLEGNLLSFITNSQFLNNTSGSCLYVSQQTNTLGSKLQFLYNTADNGIVYLENSHASISNAQFQQNFASTGSAVFIKAASFVTVSLSSCLFESNKAEKGTVYISHSESYTKLVTVLINLCSFKTNLAESGSGVYFESVTVSNKSSISNTQFIGNQGSNLGVLVVQENQIFIVNSQFKLNTAPRAVILYLDNLLSDISKVTMENSLVSNNTGDSLIYASSLNTTSQILLNGVAFINNTAQCLKLQNSYASLNSSYFIANIYTTSPCIYSTNSQIFLRSCQVMYNYGSVVGSMRISANSFLSCWNCTFYYNVADHGGCIYISESGYVNIDQSNFLNNISPSYGSVIYLVDSSANKNIIKNSNFKQNMAGISGTITSLGGSIDIYDSVFTQNLVYGFSPGISTSMGNLTMYRCTCFNQTGYVGGFISSTSLSYINIHDSLFFNANVIQGGAFLMATSFLTVTNSTFRNLTAQVGGCFSLISASEGFFFNISAYNSTASDTGGVLYGIQSNITLVSSLFDGFNDRGIYADKVVILSIQSSTFNSGYSSQGGGFLLCISCIYIEINNTHLFDISANSGGALSIYYQENQQKPTCVIASSVFENISAVTSGVISSIDYNVSVLNTQFYNNSAFGNNNTLGSGGVIEFSCSINENCNLYMAKNTFISNYARDNGGCICWSGVMPQLINNIFLDNRAEYGPNIGSFPVQMSLYNESLIENLTLFEIAPGQLVNSNITIALIDHYGQIVSTDNKTSASLSMNDSDSYVTGTTMQTSSKGLITFSNFLIYAKVNSSHVLLISSEKIQELAQVSIEMRNCTLGEGLSDKSCVSCVKGQYSLDPTGPCIECLPNAYCFGNYTVVPVKDYWRANKLSTNFYKCPIVNTCLGGEGSGNYMGDCAAGYTSNMCQSCAEGYSRSTGGVCQQCPGINQNIGYLTMIIVFIVLVVGGLVYINISMADKPVANYTILIKILLNYIQIIGIVSSMNLDWPEFALSYLHVQEAAGSLTQQSFSFDCFLSQKYDRTNTQVYFDKLFLYLLLPVALTGICLFFWSIVSIIKLDSKYIRNHFVGSVVIIALLLHSIIIKVSFSPFSCTYIEGDLYLNDDMKIKCWTGSHKYYTLSVALPTAIIWGLFIPVIILFFTYRNRESFEELEIKQRYGFVIAGYHKSTYYWEIVIIYRKVLVILASIVFGPMSIELQTLSVLIILLIASYIQTDLKPFLSDIMNKIEFRSIIVSVITIYCGLYYLTPSVSQEARIVLFVLLVSFNSIFFTYWAYYFVKDFYKAAVEFVKQCLSRRRRSIIPDPSNHTPGFNESLEDEKIIDASEIKSKSIEEVKEDEFVPIREGKKVTALSAIVKGDEKGSVIKTGLRNTVRYNAFEDTE